MSKTKNVVNFVLLAGLGTLAGYIVWLSNTMYVDVQTSQNGMLSMIKDQSALATKYAGLYHENQIKLEMVTQELASTKKMYDETQQILASVKQDLESTRGVLAQAQNILIQAKEGKIDVKNVDLAALQNINLNQMTAQGDQLEHSISNLQNRNSSLSDEINKIKEQLSRYEGNVNNQEQAKNALSLLRNRIKQIKDQLRSFRSEAQETRTLALRERDRIRLLLGNNGYLMKDGQVIHVDLAKFAAADPNSIQDSQTAQRKVDINVTFFK